MRMSTSLAAIIIATTLPGSKALADDYWAGCSGCGAAMQNFALGVPGNLRGSHVVNVYDDIHDNLQSYDVSVYYDYEFRAWSRFARRQPTSVDAMTTLASVRSAEAFAAELVDIDVSIDIETASVQDYLLSRGALDQHLATRLINGLYSRGFRDRLLDAAALLASKAGRMIARRDLEATFRVNFDDGSSMLAAAKFVANDIDNPVITYVGNSARLPDGTLLPDSNADIDTLIVATDSHETIDSIMAWVRLFEPRTWRTIGIPRAGMGHRFILTCNDIECALTAQAVE